MGQLNNIKPTRASEEPTPGTDTSSRSYFLHAGAGAGKTRSLVESISSILDSRGEELRASGSRIAVVTYTNAASDEIKSRIDHEAMVEVSTIHSFAWRMIGEFTRDIATWLTSRIREQLDDLNAKESAGRRGTKASDDRVRRIAAQMHRLELLPSVTKFIYSPLQTRVDLDGLSHAEVLAAFSDFMQEKATFRSILVGRHPVVLVDEVQDTNRQVLDALLAAERAHPTEFTLGLFGDTMQRIYLEGHPDIESALPAEWDRPSRDINYRSAKRIVRLANSIRAAADSRVQDARPEAGDGLVRLFLATSDSNRDAVENKVRIHMAGLRETDDWTRDNGANVKTLILEHAMAARRLGFEDFLGAFAEDVDLRSAIMSRDGANSPEAHFLGNQLVPLVNALTSNDLYQADLILKKYSPLLNNSLGQTIPSPGRTQVDQARSGVKEFADGLRPVDNPTLAKLLQLVQGSGLLAIPDVLVGALASVISNSPTDSADEVDPEQVAWARALMVHSTQFEKFFEYVSGRTQYDTQQGVKGLEFPRVLVILDDAEARGFLFSYDKLFGTRDLSPTDTANIASGIDSVIARSRRLLYVACTRAISDLAVVLYSGNLSSARQTAVDSGWFDESEISEIVDIGPITTTT